MKTKIISVGSEILSGDIVDTNSNYIAKKLQDIGINVENIITVADDFKKIINIVKRESQDADIIIITGGLGPTEDDITKEAVTAAFDMKNIKNEESYKRLAAYFANNEFAIENNNKQILFPREAEILPNEYGTADGFSIIGGNCKLYILPGPPREMIPMFNKFIYPRLEEKSDSIYISRYYRIYGIGEWRVEKTILDLIHDEDEIATYSKKEGLFIKIKIKAENSDKAEKRFKEYERILKERFNDNYMGAGIEKPEVELAKLLEKNNISISCAESITGGLIASNLINYPGISNNLKESYIVYSDESKIKTLGVNKDSLERFTAVSEEVLNEMLDGLYKKTKVDLVIATTGYAGPGGDDPGLVYYGAMYRNKKSLIKRRFKGDRNYIRQRTANDAILNAWSLIKENI